MLDEPQNDQLHMQAQVGTKQNQALTDPVAYKGH
jgi:hypothetical protein